MRSAEALAPIQAPPRRLSRLIRNRETAFWGLQLIGWSGYFLAQLISGLFYPEKMPPEKTVAWAYVLVVAALTGFALSSLLRLVYRRIRDRPPSVLVPTVLVTVYAAALTWRM
jgi:two-component system, LytTR family, sensor kinase